MKTWKEIHWSDTCPLCGSSVVVFTDCRENNFAYDGDAARCVECGNKGSVSTDGLEGGNTYINWNDWPQQAASGRD